MKSIYEFLLKSKTTISTQGIEYVDLGLPSGLLWATCNIGADEPTNYGDYFMWGSTKPNTNDKCDWKNCPFNNDNDDYGYDNDYFESIKNKVCPNDILAPKYDAATAILGDDWRLPTDDEFYELMNNTNYEWVENYKGSKINGMIFIPTGFTTKKSKANGTELFIPAAGYRSGSGFYCRRSSAYLWSSSLFTSSPNYAKYFYLDDSYCYVNHDDRFYGFCLRAVKENK